LQACDDPRSLEGKLEKKEDEMARSKVFFLAPLVFLAVILTACPPPGVGPPEAPRSWTTDLSAVGFGIVNFVYGGDVGWHPDSYFLEHPYKEGVCTVMYNPRLLFGTPLAEADDPFAAQFRLANSLINCGLFLPENADLRRRFEANFQAQAFATWLSEYFASCGESFFLLGWIWDPDKERDFACVPGFREVVERYIE